MLITFAGVGLFSTPAISPPLAQVIDVAMSESSPPRHDKALIGWIFAPGAIPAIPSWLLFAAAITPAMWVPCQAEFLTGEIPRQSPGSVGFESQPRAPYFSLFI
jgi:hypothetical protein